MSSDRDRPLPKDRRRHSAAETGAVSTIAGTAGAALGVTTTGAMRGEAAEAWRSFPFQRGKYFGSRPRVRQLAALGLA